MNRKKLFSAVTHDFTFFSCPCNFFSADTTAYVFCSKAGTGWVTQAPDYTFLYKDSALLKVPGFWKTCGGKDVFLTQPSKYEYAARRCTEHGYEVAQPSQFRLISGNWYPFQVCDKIKPHYAKTWGVVSDSYSKKAEDTASC